MAPSKKFIITAVVISVSLVLAFTLYMSDFSLLSLKYSNPKMEGYTSASGSIEQSKDVNTFVKQLHIDKDKVKISDSLEITFGDCWIEKTWLFPQAFKKIEFSQKYLERYSIIIQYHQSKEETCNWYIKNVPPTKKNESIGCYGNPDRFQAFHSSIEDTFYYEIFQRIVDDTNQLSREETIEKIKFY